MSIDGKNILVAGAAGSQGRATIALFLDSGAKVLAGDSDEAGLDELRKLPGASSDSLKTEVLDVSSEDDWRHIGRAGTEAFGTLDGMVNFAAALYREGLEDATAEDWRRILEVNVIGTWLGIKEVVPILRENGGGSIVSIGSVDALVGRGGATAYQASKGAVRMLTKSAASQYARENIRINCVHPGPMEQRMRAILGPSRETTDPTALAERLQAEIPLGRLGAASDIAFGVKYLLSDESSFVTGIDLAVDGGLTAV